jgi:hypothetical protein
MHKAHRESPRIAEDDDDHELAHGPRLRLASCRSRAAHRASVTVPQKVGLSRASLSSGGATFLEGIEERTRMITNSARDDAATPPQVATKLKDAGCRREFSIAYVEVNLVEQKASRHWCANNLSYSCSGSRGSRVSILISLMIMDVTEN